MFYTVYMYIFNFQSAPASVSCDNRLVRYWISFYFTVFRHFKERNKICGFFFSLLTNKFHFLNYMRVWTATLHITILHEVRFVKCIPVWGHLIFYIYYTISWFIRAMFTTAMQTWVNRYQLQFVNIPRWHTFGNINVYSIKTQSRTKY